MKKSIKVISTLLICILSMSTSVFAAGKLPKEASDTKINIYINNEMQNIPEEMGRAYFDKTTNRVMVPARYISENLGATIQFYTRKENNKNGIFIGNVYGVIELDIGSNVATISSADNSNVEKKELDAPAILYDARTYVPLRFISEAMNMEVDWKDNTVYIKGATTGSKKQREELKKSISNGDAMKEDSKDSVNEDSKSDANTVSSNNSKNDSEDVKIEGSLF